MICFGTTTLAEARQSVEDRRPPAVSKGRMHGTPFLLDPARLKQEAGAVHVLDEPAPGSNCGPHKFEIMNADPGEETCVGLDMRR
jgi:hypothetical protein